MARGKATDPPPDGPEPGEGPAAAKDGQPDDNELARRRAARTGSSVADRVADTKGDSDDSDGTELFPLGTFEGDAKVTLKNLIPANARVTVSASLSSAEAPLQGGLLDPTKEIELLVRALPCAPVPVAKHREAKVGGDHTIDDWTIRQPIRTIHVQPAGEMYTREQVIDMMHEAGVPTATVSKVLGIEPEAAQA